VYGPLRWVPIAVLLVLVGGATALGVRASTAPPRSVSSLVTKGCPLPSDEGPVRTISLPWEIRQDDGRNLTISVLGADDVCFGRAVVTESSTTVMIVVPGAELANGISDLVALGVEQVVHLKSALGSRTLVHAPVMKYF
jgi:hypothetical protein